MKKNLFLAGLLTTFSLVAKSQVGINTATPTATLDVTAKNSTGTGSAPEGLLIPRVDRQKAQSMTGVPISTLIYVNSIATGTAAGTAVNIDTAGYYYYNGTVWTKLNNPVNIYNADGNLNGNRTVTQGANTLAFTGTQTNAFSVDGNTLSVDAANDRVGVGTTTPDTKLTISTPDNSFGLNHTNGTINLKTYIGGGAGYLGTTTSNNLNLMTNNSVKMTIIPAGNIGVGTNAPDNSALLDLTSSNKGLLLPRVSLTSTTDASTVPAPAKGLMVYNNNTAMSPQGEGIYYNGGTSTAPDWGKIGPVSKMYFKYYAFSNPSGDYVSNFDTKIPVNKYTAIVVGFDTSNHASINSGFKNANTNFDFQVPDIYTFQENGTWRIYADVPNASTNNVTTFSWGVRLLIISNEQMSLLSDSVYNLGGGSTGAATVSPVP